MRRGFMRSVSYTYTVFTMGRNSISEHTSHSLPVLEITTLFINITAQSDYLAFGQDGQGGAVNAQV